VIVAAALPRSGAQPPKGAPLPEVKIGLPNVLFRDIHPALVDIAATPFKEMIQKIAGMNGSLVKAKDYKILAEQLKEKQVDVALFHGFEYAWVENPDLIPLAVTLPKCGKVQACLVVNVGSKAKEPKELKGACVAVPKGSKAHCQMFLERLRESLPNPGDCCPIEVKGTPPTADEVLDDVASGCGTCEAALVDISSLLAYRAAKPGAGACLRILTESELLPAAVIVCRRDSLTAKQMKAITDGLLDCPKTVEGQLFLTFWSWKGFGRVTEDYRDSLEKSRKAYPVPANPKK
jgi:ABC-type phosphate/phosphonate transport system substrate-binding protein